MTDQTPDSKTKPLSTREGKQNYELGLPRERKSLKRSFLKKRVEWRIEVVLRKMEVWKTQWQNRRNSSHGLVPSMLDIYCLIALRDILDDDNDSTWQVITSTSSVIHNII